MPLSKARDRERKRLARLEKLLLSPQTSKSVQPISYAKAVAMIEKHSFVGTPWIDDIAEFVDSASEDIDADIIPDGF